MLIDLFSLLFELRILIYVVAAVHDGRMFTSAEELSDLLVFEFQIVSANEHCNITCCGDLGTSELRSKLIGCQIVVICNCIYDYVRRQILLIAAYERIDDLSDVIQGKLPVSESYIRRNSIKSAVKLSDVCCYVLADIVDYLV